MIRNNKSIVVASTSLSELFCGEPIEAHDGNQIRGKLNLPEYQRPYCWSEKQLARLISDLNHYFDPTLPDPPSHDFYLGSIILHQKHDEQNNAYLNVIDGQQRLTTMALLAHQSRLLNLVPALEFNAPQSHEQIRANFDWLSKRSLPLLDLNRINVTLVVTNSEDDAYRFFETQNTGGVRLSGPDIIKAYHLRALPASRQSSYAKIWESMGDLNPLMDSVMKGRYWQKLDWKELPSSREPRKQREVIIKELAEETLTDQSDIAYRNVKFGYSHNNGWDQYLPVQGYAMRQPLNSGVNAIHYLRYFQELRQQLFYKQSVPELEGFYEVYNIIVTKSNGSPFLKKLFECAILLYSSKFGLTQLHEAALWIFRVVYSPRLRNEKVVRESTVQSFVRETPLLDWIDISYNHNHLLQFLTQYKYSPDVSNLDKSSVKLNFVKSVMTFFHYELNEPKEIAALYDTNLQIYIKKRIAKEKQR